MGRLTKIISLILALIILFGILFFSLSKYTITGNPIEELNKNENYQYTYTKAICNETNFCQDYEIVCNNNTVANMKPITGAVVQHPSNWEDPRDEDRINGFCNI